MTSALKHAAPFAMWLAIGVGGAFGLLTAPSIGVFVLPAVVAFGWHGQNPMGMRVERAA
jgi:hypothetical protein